MDTEVLLAFGANIRSFLGEPSATISAAVQSLIAGGLAVETQSRFYSTPCFPAGAGPDFVNSAARGRWGGTPEALLALLHEVEAEFGRTREARWAARSLDIDLIAFGDAVRPDEAGYRAWLDLPLEDQGARAPEELVLPHPRLQDRAFVLIPLADVAPDWRHPVLGQSVAELCAALPEGEKSAVKPLVAA